MAVIQEKVDEIEGGLQETNTYDEELIKDIGKLKVLKSIQKTNESELTLHEKDLFKLKDCERESNKYL